MNVALAKYASFALVYICFFTHITSVYFVLKFMSPDQAQAIMLLCLSTVVHSLSPMAAEWGLDPPHWYF